MNDDPENLLGLGYNCHYGVWTKGPSVFCRYFPHLAKKVMSQVNGYKCVDPPDEEDT